MYHAPYIIWLFALGACVGSFLNVVVWRLPRGQSLISPPSHCPKCDHRLAWYDNIPVFGWLMLRGQCRYCHQPISPRYPIIEFITGALFVFYYVMFFIVHIGPIAPVQQTVTDTLFRSVTYHDITMGSIAQHWPVYVLMMYLISSLLAASLIDGELFIIPLEIPWLMAVFGILVHTLIDRPSLPGALSVGRDGLAGALAAGGGIGLLISMGLLALGKMPRTFPDGEPALEIDHDQYQAAVAESKREGLPVPVMPKVYTKREIRREILKEVLFVLPPLLGAVAAAAAVYYIDALGNWWRGLMGYDWLTGLLGAILGALVGGGIIWITRILATLALGRVAMGLGDVHLMFGVGAMIGAGPAVVVFFLAPFAALAVGLYGLITRHRRELPYGPYLSLATAVVLLAYAPIAHWMAPGLAGLRQMAWLLLGRKP